ncbi:MAG: hypothetical protein WD077_11660 [Bacteroidia bacterium]
MHEIRSLFDSGLIKELNSKELIPQTCISKYRLENFGLVLSHEKIPVISYPYEWTFGMLQDAGITILKVNEIARNYGYQTKDGHGLNVLFHYGTPKFVDIGSFVPLGTNKMNWMAYEEFIKYFLYPLRMWADQSTFLARYMLSGRLNLIAHTTFYLYKYPVLRYLKASTVDKVLTNIYKFRKISLNSGLLSKKGKRIDLLSWLLRNNLLPFQSVSFAKLSRTIKRIKIKSNEKEGNSGTTFLARNSESVSSKLETIEEVLSRLQVKTVLELGGMEGILSCALSDQKRYDRITYAGYNYHIVERLYNSIKVCNITVSPLLLNFLNPINNIHHLSASIRLCSDAVLVLAEIHNLLLTERYSIHAILQVLLTYTRKFLLIEFMPLGLKGSGGSQAPSWYSIEWFRASVKIYCEVIEEVSLDVDRILFVLKFKDERKI